MTITAEAIVQVANLCVVTGIFYRLGSFKSNLENTIRRVDKLEAKTC